MESMATALNPNLDGGYSTPPCWFSLNNAKTVKAVTLVPWYFVGFSNFLSEKLVPNFTFVTCPRVSAQSLIYI